MGVFKFTGNLQGVSTIQLDYISKVLENRGFKGPDASLNPVGVIGDNYMANVVRITVTENGETFKMVAKLAPEGEMLRQMAQVQKVYKNECIIYTEVLLKFAGLQKSAGVEPLFRSAECYGCLETEPNEVILLEDLKDSNFEMLDRFKPLSNEAVKIALKNFAIYHSLSYVLKDQDPEAFDSLKVKFGDMMDGPMSQSEEGRNWCLQLEESVLSILVEEKHKKHVREKLRYIFDDHQIIEAADKGSKYTVIQQGDGWTNNIMFRLQDNVPVECVLIDYQMAKERNPAFDIMYFVFNSTTHEQRQKHYHEYLDYYHSELDRSLNNFGLKASEVFPREQLDRDLKRFAKFMLSVNIMISSTILKQTDEARRTKEMMASQTREEMTEKMAGMFQLGAETRALLKERVEGLIDSFVEFGIKEMMTSQTREDMTEKMAGMFQLGAETRALLKERVEGLIDSFVEFGYL